MISLLIICHSQLKHAYALEVLNHVIIVLPTLQVSAPVTLDFEDGRPLNGHHLPHSFDELEALVHSLDPYIWLTVTIDPLDHGHVFFVCFEVLLGREILYEGLILNPGKCVQRAEPDRTAVVDLLPFIVGEDMLVKEYYLREQAGCDKPVLFDFSYGIVSQRQMFQDG